MEVEWEFVSWVGSKMCWYYGYVEVLLLLYVKYLDNSKNYFWLVGDRFFNVLGLFDMLGNVYEWC